MFENDPNIEFYKRGVINYPIRFNDPEWAKVIQNDIDHLNVAINALILMDCSFVFLALTLSISTTPAVACAMLVASAPLYYYSLRHPVRKLIDNQIDKLGQVFMKVVPEDTAIPVVLNLTYAIASLIADEKILKGWMPFLQQFPQRDIDVATEEFKQILNKRGFFHVQNFNSKQEALKTVQSDVSSYQNHRLFEQLKAKLRFIYFGKGKLSDLFTDLKLHEYYIRKPNAKALTSSSQSVTLGLRGDIEPAYVVKFG